jgi:hypothetical protein
MLVRKSARIIKRSLSKNEKARYQQCIHEGDVFLPCIFEAFGYFEPWAYQQISSALWLSNARHCIRLAGLIRSNHYAVFDNPVNAPTVDDYIPAANTSAAPVADALFSTQDFATTVAPPALPCPYSSPVLPSSAPAPPSTAIL